MLVKFMNHYSSRKLTPYIVTQSLPSKIDLITSLTSLLTLVCASTEWEYGESWIPDDKYPTLELSSAWSINPDLDNNRETNWMQFQICSKQFVLSRGEGLPGRVWQSRQSEWLDDVSVESESYFLRHQIAKALNVRAGMAIPILENSQVLAVVIFFMSKAQSPDPVLMASTQAAIWNFQSELANYSC